MDERTLAPRSGKTEELSIVTGRKCELRVLGKILPIVSALNRQLGQQDYVLMSGSIRRVSTVSAQAVKRTGAHFKEGWRCMVRNRKPPQWASCSQVSSTSAANDKRVSRPSNFGAENGTSASSETPSPGCTKDRILTSFRFGNKDMKWDRCRGVPWGMFSVSDLKEGDKCPK